MLVDSLNSRGGAVKTPLTEKAQAISGDPLLIGRYNEDTEKKTTYLWAKIDSVPHDAPQYPPSAFTVENPGEETEPADEHHPPVAIFGWCRQGMGVSGISDIHEGVHGRSDSGTGVHGVSVTGIGVRAIAESETGTALRVDGKSQCGADVVATVPGEFPPAFHVSNCAPYYPESGLHPPVALAGHCPNGFAVHGSGDQGIHGHGVSVGVYATSENGLALKVEGRSECHAKVDTADVPPHGLPIAFSVFNDGVPDPTISPKAPVAIVGDCPRGVGVTGFSVDSWAVHGNSTNNAGVYGYSDNDTGVWGWSPKGRGVYAQSDGGIGVRAESNGIALQVLGKSSFSTVGSGTIPAFKKSYTVDLPAGPVTDKSHISVTLTSDPNLIGEDAAVSFVVRDPKNNRFIINLTKAVGRETTFTYFIVEP